MRVYQAFRFELDPGNRARSALSSHAGAARFACKWGLATVRAHRAAYEACRALALRQGASAVEAKAWAGEVVGLLACTLPARHRQWDRAKAEVAPWWAANSKEAYNSGLDALARALKGSFSPRSGRRRGHPVGPPPSKKRGPRQGSRVTTGAFGVVDGRHVRLPRIGVLRTNEPTSKMVARLAGGSARVPSATVSRQAGRWYVSFGCEVDRPASRLVVADRWYPSSKTCSACRAVKTKLALSERTFRCEHCGVALDRDDNAAFSLASLAGGTITNRTASGAGTGRDVVPANAQGEAGSMDISRCASVNCEGSTGRPGKAATAAERSTAA